MLKADFGGWARELLAECGVESRQGTLLDDLPPLSRVLDLLQESIDEPADCGLARMSPAALDVLSSSAASQSDHCLDRIRLVFELLESCETTGALPPSQATLKLLCREVLALLQEYRRWALLADNAGFYRDHPQVAERVAQEWRLRRE